MSASLHPATEPPDDTQPDVLKDALLLAAQGVEGRRMAPGTKSFYGGTSNEGWLLDRDEIVDELRRYRRANWGLRTGREAGLYIVDDDPRNHATGFGAEEERRAFFDQLPPTRTLSTPSGGTHRYYWGPPNMVTAGGVPKGIDILDSTSDAVGAGSVIVKNGQVVGRYVVIDDRPIADLPAAVKLIERRERPVPEPVAPRPGGPHRWLRTAIERHTEDLERVAEGERADTVFKTALTIGGWCAGEAVPADEYATILDRITAAGVRSGITEAEARHNATSGFDKGFKAPLRYGGGQIVLDGMDPIRMAIAVELDRWARMRASTKSARTDRATMLGFLTAAHMLGRQRIDMSYREIAEHAGVSVETIQKSLRRLRDAGVITMAVKGFTDRETGRRVPSVWDVDLPGLGAEGVEDPTLWEGGREPAHTYYSGGDHQEARKEKKLEFEISESVRTRVRLFAQFAGVDLFRESGPGKAGHQVMTGLLDGEQISVDDLADRSGVSVRQLTKTDRRKGQEPKPSVLGGLHELGLVDWDRGSRTVKGSPWLLACLDAGAGAVEFGLARSAMLWDRLYPHTTAFGSSIRQRVQHLADRSVHDRDFGFHDVPVVDDPEVLVEELVAELEDALDPPVAVREPSLPVVVGSVEQVRERRRRDRSRETNMVRKARAEFYSMRLFSIAEIGPGRECVACGDPAPPGVRSDWKQCDNTCRGRKKRSGDRRVGAA